MKTITQQLREALKASEETRYAISKATGIGQDTLSRFIHGERGLSMESLDALGLHLGLELRPAGKSQAKRG